MEVASNNTDQPPPSTSTLWSISVRTVGGGGSSGFSPSPSAPISRSVSDLGAATTASAATAAVAGGIGSASSSAPNENDNDDNIPGSSVVPSTPTTTKTDAGTIATTAAQPPASAGSGIGNDGHHPPFTVMIDPNDTIASLHDKIYDHTGLSVDRQRLIYRGKIISAGTSTTCTGGMLSASAHSTPTAATSGAGGNGREEEQEDEILASGSSNGNGNGNGKKICDVAGLTDGQTIHLVPRPAASSSTPASASAQPGAQSRQNGGVGGSGSGSGSGSGDALASAILGEGGTSVGSGGAALLAALLGLGGLGSGGADGGGAAGLEGEDEDDIDDLGVDLGAGGATTAGAGGVGAGTADILGTGIGPILTGGGSALPPRGTTGRRSRRGGQNAAASARPSHVVTADDVQERRSRDLTSLEPVRQGLMTAHTLLHGARLEGGRGVEPPSLDTSSESGQTSTTTRRGLPPRRFYRGQWVDALDTVNSWLEATVVDIATPEDVLGIRPPAIVSEHHHGEANPHRNRRGGLSGVVRREDEEEAARGGRQGQPPGDPIVGANDWDGRRMLLLEPDPHADDVDPIARFRPYAPEGQDLSSYRERPSNVENDVQLLLIHYNGWPRRWDEWIRSDSTRIRPFRSRTRHTSGSQAQAGRRQRQPQSDQGRVGACPSIRAAFHAAPSTHICPRGPESASLSSLASDNETTERVAALSELRTLLRQIDGLITACVVEEEGNAAEVGETSRESSQDVHGHVGTNGEEDEIEDEEGEDRYGEHFFGGDDPFLEECDEEDRARYLPWQTGAAIHEEEHDGVVHGEHIAGPRLPSFAAASGLDPETRLRTLAPLLDRVGRVCVSLAPHVCAMSESCSQQTENIVTNADVVAPVERAVMAERAGDGVAPITPNADNATDEDDNGNAGRDQGFDVHDAEGEAPLDDTPVAGERERTEREESSVTMVASTVAAPISTAPEVDWWSVEPDMADFTNATVNDVPSPERGPSRGARGRSRVGSSVGDNLTSALLAAALAGSAGGTGGTAANGAAAGASDAGPRVINLGGGTREGSIGGGSGIDIHVHMLVTAPSPSFGGRGAHIGGGGGGGGVAAQPAAVSNVSAASVPRTPQAGHQQSSPASVSDEDEDDLFAELYTETPPPASWSTPRSSGSSDDDSPGVPSTFADDDANDDASLSNDEPLALSEIESDDDSIIEEASSGNQDTSSSPPPSPSPSSSPRQASENSGGVTANNSSPSPTSRRSPLSRLFRRSRRRR